jgi:hypothetical protein
MAPAHLLIDPIPSVRAPRKCSPVFATRLAGGKGGRNALEHQLRNWHATTSSSGCGLRGIHGLGRRSRSIGGGSAGGTIALSALELARQAGRPAVRTCVLVVPTVDQTVAPEQYTSPSLSPRPVQVIRETYVADASRREPLASPSW